MSKPEDKRVFLPITKHDEKLKVTAPGSKKPGETKIETLLMTIVPDCPTYEKVPVSEFKEKNKNVVSAQETYFDKVGNQITNKPLTNDDIFRFRMLTNQANLNDILAHFKDDTYFVKPYMYDDGYTPFYFYEEDQQGGRKRKQSKYSSKKRSIKSRRRRNSRKRRYSRRR
jgi:hypothetical protein